MPVVLYVRQPTVARLWRTQDRCPVHIRKRLMAKADAENGHVMESPQDLRHNSHIGGDNRCAWSWRNDDILDKVPLNQLINLHGMYRLVVPRAMTGARRLQYWLALTCCAVTWSLATTMGTTPLTSEMS